MVSHCAHSSLVAIAVAVSVSVAAPSASVAQTSNEAIAQLRFQRGRDLFNQQRFVDALAEFQATVALVGSPNTRLYIARCLHELGRNAEALLEYQHAAAEAADRSNAESRYAATRDAAREEASHIEPLVGRLALHLSAPIEGVTITADGQPVPRQMVDVPAPFDPHGVRLVVQAPGYRPSEQTVTIQAGHVTELTVHLDRLPGSRRLTASAAPATRMVTVRTGGEVRLVGLVVGGVGLVGGVVGTALFGAQAQARFDELQRTCVAPCPELEPRIAQGELDRTLSNASLGAGVALLIVGSVMAVVGGPRLVARTESALSARPVHIAPWGAATGQGGLAGLSAVF